MSYNPLDVQVTLTLWTHQRAGVVALVTLCYYTILGLAFPEGRVPELNESMLCGNLDQKLDNGTKHASIQWLASMGRGEPFPAIMPALTCPAMHLTHSSAFTAAVNAVAHGCPALRSCCNRSVQDSTRGICAGLNLAAGA